MKNRLISLYCITLCIFCQALAFSNPVFATNANDFYFENAKFDYYLEKDPETGSKMKVVETLTAVFPDTDQNHGITREIPFTNQSGKNRTINNLDLVVTRNGEPEPFSYSEERGYYYVKIGSASEYVHGLQTYTLAYTFENVITSFDESGNLTYNNQDISFQELYWDTNGTGWSQKFNNLTATVHFENSSLFKSISDKNIHCYVGYQGSENHSRCNISDDLENLTFTFTTSDLGARENLTFAIKFNKNTFPVAKPKYNYVVIIMAIIIFIVFLYWLILILKNNKKYRPLRIIYKDTPIVPQYTPLKDLSPAEASKLLINIKPKGSPEVATLINLAVNHKIHLKKGDKKIFGGYNWEIEILSAENLSVQEQTVLDLLNNASKVKTGDTIKVENHPYKSSLATLSHTFNYDITKNLKSKQLIKSSSSARSFSSVFIPFFCMFFLFGPMAIIFAEFIDDQYSIILGEDFIPALVILWFAIPISSLFIISRIENKIKDKTEEGVKIARYYDGLYYYMKLAETERIKFLQSVENIDTSPQGIVNLYEKLLPYAIIFGIENSWMGELNKYYTLENVADSAWFDGTTLSLYDINNFNHYINASITSGTVNHSSLDADSGSGSSWSSSSSSGSSGGGFSGGGGGGGGGGGW